MDLDFKDSCESNILGQYASCVSPELDLCGEKLTDLTQCWAIYGRSSDECFSAGRNLLACVELNNPSAAQQCGGTWEILKRMKACKRKEGFKHLEGQNVNQGGNARMLLIVGVLLGAAALLVCASIRKRQ